MPLNQSGVNETVIDTYNDVAGNQTNDNSKIAHLTSNPSNENTYCYITGVKNYNTYHGGSQGEGITNNCEDWDIQLINIILFDQANFTINGGQLIFNSGLGHFPEPTLKQNATITYE